MRNQACAAAPRLAVLAVAVFPLLASCGGLSEGGEPAVGESSGPPPPNCDVEAVETVVQDFLRAFNGGDMDTAMQKIAVAEQFKWYSVGQTGDPGSRLGEEAKNRARLADYLHARHEQRERIVAKELRVTGNSEYGQGENFAMSVLRSAEDLAIGGIRAWGKGVVDCMSAKIVLLSY